MRGKLRAVVGGSVTLALAAVLAPQAIAAANPKIEFEQSMCQETGRYEVCTTSPEEYADGVDLTIIRRLREYVQSTDSGVIRGAMYLWKLDDSTPDTQRLVDDLIAAKDRGVDVDIVLGSDGTTNDDTEARFEAGGIDPEVCVQSCLPGASGGKAGIMHIKFFTFASGDTRRVVHTSSNLMPSQYQEHQNLLSVTGDQRLYDNYVGYWNRLNVGSWTYDGDEWTGSERARDGDVEGIKSYFFPRTQADPVRGTLEKLRCGEGHARVWVAASIFKGVEREPVRDVLEDLYNSGCDVRIVVKNPEHRAWIVDNTNLPDDKVRVLDGAGEAWRGTHNKLIVTNAWYEGTDRKAVYAGSHNLNEGSLRNSSDGMLRVTDLGVYNIYRDYYQSLYELAHT